MRQQSAASFFSLQQTQKVKERWRERERKQKGNRSPGMFAKAHYKWSREDNVWLFFFFAVSSSCSRREKGLQGWGCLFLGSCLPRLLSLSCIFSHLRRRLLHMLGCWCASTIFFAVFWGYESERGWFFFFVPKRKRFWKPPKTSGVFFAACLIDYLNVVEKGRFSIYSNIR